MPLLNEADSIYLGDVEVDAIFVGDQLAWPPAVGPQPKVSNVSAYGTLTVSWASVTNASAYELRRNGTLIKTTNLTTYNDSGLAWSTNYTYTIVPIVFSVPGDESAPSIVVNIPTPKGNTPTLSNASAAGSLTVSWTATPEASSYRVYRNSAHVATTSARVYSDSGLAWNSSYSYQVVPLIGTRVGTISSSSNPLTIPKGSLGDIYSSNKTYTNVTVSWNAALGATSYNVYVNGTYRAGTTSTSYSVATTQNTTISIYVIPIRNGVSGFTSTTRYYYSGRAEVRDTGSKSDMVFSPSKVDSWRPVDDWDWLSNIAAQGYYNSSYGNYKGVAYYGTNGARDSLRTSLGANGTNRQLYGSCTKAEVYLYKKTGIGTYGTVETVIRRSNSTASGGEPSGSDAVTRTTPKSGDGAWISVGTGHGQALGDGEAKSLMFRNDGSANYAQFTDCRLRLSWSWNYVLVTAAPNNWY